MIRPLAVAPSVVRSAFRAGSLRGTLIRHSRRSSSGVVLVCAFASRQRAASFAARWAKRLGVSVVVRPFPRPGRDLLFAVSLPVAGCVPFGDPSSGPSAWAVAGVPSVARVARSVSVALL